MVYFMENPINMDDLGYHYFWVNTYVSSGTLNFKFKNSKYLILTKLQYSRNMILTKTEYSKFALTKIIFHVKLTLS